MLFLCCRLPIHIEPRDVALYMIWICSSNSVYYLLLAGYMVSTAASDVNIAVTIAPLVMIPMLLFGGFFLNAEYVHVYMYKPLIFKTTIAIATHNLI